MSTVNLFKKYQTLPKVHNSQYIRTENTDGDNKPEEPTKPAEEPKTEQRFRDQVKAGPESI